MIGTPCTLRIDWDASDFPVEGDLLRSEPGGSCYRIDELHESAKTPRRLVIRATRLGKDACHLGDDGVFPFWWNPR